MTRNPAINGTAARQPSAVDRHIADRIRSVRETSGLSQADLAERLGITCQQLSKYECARNRVSASRLWDISVALGERVQWFYPEGGE